MSEERSLKATCCVMLCCKKWQYREMPGPEPDPDHLSPPAQFWCAETLTEFGPDDQEAYLEVCQPDRKCYRAIVPSRQE